jgi:hypothetical protein
MATTATLEEFIIFSGEYDLSEDDKLRIQMLLDQAARQITSYLGTSNWATPANLETGLESDGGSIAKDRQLHIVKRYWDNPTGVVSESYDGVSVAMDDRSYEGLRLTPYDKQVLSRNRKSASKITHRWISRNNGNVW